MPEKVLQWLFAFVFFVLPGVVAARVAWTKGRNWIGWFILCLFFPPTVVVIFFQDPTREVKGHYRRCPRCGAWLKWRETTCRYCQAEIA